MYDQDAMKCEACVIRIEMPPAEVPLLYRTERDYTRRSTNYVVAKKSLHRRDGQHIWSWVHCAECPPDLHGSPYHDAYWTLPRRDPIWHYDETLWAQRHDENEDEDESDDNKQRKSNDKKKITKSTKLKPGQRRWRGTRRGRGQRRGKGKGRGRGKGRVKK